MTKKSKTSISVLGAVLFIVLAFPLVSFAATPCIASAPCNFKELVNIFIGIIATAIPVVAGLAVLYFFWGLAKYIFAQGNEQSKVDGKSIMTWGLIGLFFMFSIYGVLQFFGSVLPQFPGGGLPSNNQGSAPNVPLTEYPDVL